MEPPPAPRVMPSVVPLLLPIPRPKENSPDRPDRPPASSSDPVCSAVRAVRMQSQAICIFFLFIEGVLLRFKISHIDLARLKPSVSLSFCSSFFGINPEKQLGLVGRRSVAGQLC